MGGRQTEKGLRPHTVQKAAFAAIPDITVVTVVLCSKVVVVVMAR